MGGFGGPSDTVLFFGILLNFSWVVKHSVGRKLLKLLEVIEE
jgi:hypothetical protein